MKITDLDKPEKALRNILLGIIDDQIKSGFDGSLAIVSCHTGGGKTNAFCQAMAALSSQTDEEQPVCIYAVPDKKNLPIKELRKTFREYGIEKKFDEIVVVRSRRDNYSRLIKSGTLSQNLKGVISKGSTPLQDSDKTFLEGIQIAEEHFKEGKTDLFNDQMNKLFNYEYGSGESDFRKVLSQNLSEEFYRLDPSNNKRPNSKQTKELEEYTKRYWDWIDQKYPWINELYPARRAKKAKIILMTTKMLNQKAVLMTESSKTWTKYLGEGIHIVLDESDRAKDVLLNDCIDQSRETYNIFNTHARLLQAAREALDEETGLKENQTMGGLRNEEWQKFYDGRPKEITLGIRHIFDPNLDTNGSFLFKFFDEIKSGDLQDEHSKKVVLRDQTQTRYLVLGNKELTKEEKEKIDEYPDLSTILGVYIGHIRYFCSMAAHGLRKIKNEDKTAQEPYVTDSDIKSALSEIHIDRNEDLSDILAEEIRKELYPCTTNRENLNLPSYYTRGISYLSAINSEDQKEITSYNIHKMRETPEGILARWCGEAHVILLSATANSNSVLKNFDLKWLRANVPKVIRIRRDLQEKYDEYYRLYNEYSNRVNIQVINSQDDYRRYFTCIGQDENKDSNRRAVKFLSKEGKEVFLENAILEIVKEEDKNRGIFSYDGVRTIQMLLVLKFMLTDDRVRYGVIFTNQAFANNEIKLNRIKSIFEYVEGYESDLVHFLKTGEEYENRIKEIKRDVSDGKKRILIGAYNTIGVGQNLQAPIGKIDKNDLVFLNDRFEHGRDEVNLNACYLEKPTFNLSQFEFQENLDQNMRSIMQIGTEIDSLYLHDEINKGRRFAAINTLFSSYRDCQNLHLETKTITSGIRIKENLQSVILKQLMVMLQAIGRLNRSAVKFKDCFVGCDPTCFDGYFEIENLIDNKELPSLPEFEALKDYCFTYRDKLMDFRKKTDFQEMKAERPEREFERRVINKDEIARSYTRRIEEYVSYTGKWPAEEIKIYENLGELVLKHPTVTQDEFDNMNESERSLVDHYYVMVPKVSKNIEEIDKYFYSYDLKNVSFEPNPEYHQVSMEESRLGILMKKETIQKACEKDGIPIQWKAGHWVMTPTLLNNFYKGRLGEKITEIVFNKYLDIKFKPLDQDVYERFDFWYEGADGNIVLVDAKHHNDRQLEDDRKKMIAKAHRKLEDVKEYLTSRDGKEPSLSCLYVNLLHGDERDYQICEKYDEEIFVITGLITDFESILNNQSLVRKLKEGKW